MNQVMAWLGTTSVALLGISPWWWLAVVPLLWAAWYLSFVARRLDRLHRRVEGASMALDTQLLHRAQAAVEVSVGGLLDPASAVLLHAAAATAIAADAEVAAERSRLPGLTREREIAESELTRTLRATLDELDLGHPLVRAPELTDLAEACHRVRLARRFHNDAVSSSLALRRKRLVRWLRLAGSAPMPATVEIDDATPAILGSVRVPEI